MTTRWMILAVLALSASPLWAEEQDLGSAIPDKDTLIQMLAPDQPEESNVGGPPVKTRGISMEPVAEAIRKPSKPKAVSLQVYFDYNSDRLTEEAIKQLRPVGEAMSSSKLKTLDFIVEGHTDGTGSDAYNHNLSERRAQSVRQFLVMEYGIAPGRVNAVGRGKSALLDSAHPDSAVNRRVRIVAHY